MTASTPTDQHTMWNDSAGVRWRELQERLDAQLDAIGLAALERLEIAPGARVLDIGCGCGSTSLELAQRVGPEGRVVGVDISEPMLSRAEERARIANLSNLTFVKSDAQRHAFAPASFDALFSRFGVMFFDDPAAAFRNLRTALKPGAHVVFVCWRTAQENPWAAVPLNAISAFAKPDAPTDPFAPGPFAFADPDRVRTYLDHAGFCDITLTAYDTPMYFGGPGDLDAAAEFATQIGPAAALLRERNIPRSDAIHRALKDGLSPYAQKDGVVFPASLWIVHATAR